MQTTRKLIGIALVAAVCLALIAPAVADTHTWNGSADSDWFEGSNWTPAGSPVTGDDVVYTNDGTALVLTNETPVLGSLTAVDGTLTCSNWFTRIRATNVTIRNGATFTLPSAFTDAQMSNRVHIVCSNLTIEVGGQIDADGAGFKGGDSTHYSGYGEGAGLDSSDRPGGGAYGGDGGDGLYRAGGGSAYGITNAPVRPGSGGGGRTSGGAGGGVVRIAADGTVNVEGTITANGLNGIGRSGGGSGGAIYMSCDTFAGSSDGLVSVNGGNSGSITYCGGGGGGRVAVTYSQPTTPSSAVRFSAAPGTGYSEGNMDQRFRCRAVEGSVFLSDDGMLSETMAGDLFTGVRLVMDGITSWDVDHLSVSNCSVTFATEGFRITVTNDVRIDSGGVLGVAGDLVTRGGDLVLTNGGEFYLHSGSTNGLGRGYGALLSVTGNVAIGPGSALYPESHPTDGGSPLLRMGDLEIAAGGEINASAKGYAAGNGPGFGIRVGDRGAGAGHGGHGGSASDARTLSRNTYGLTNGPVAPGSGGGGANAGPGGTGGGLVRIEASGTVLVDGTVQANGTPPGTSNAGGGSGGGINISCTTFGGSAGGLMSVNAGNNSAGANGGGGGGGRIAVAYSAIATPRPEVRFSAKRGLGHADRAGYWDDRWQIGTERGTVYLSDASLLDETLDGNQFDEVYLFVGDLDAWGVESLTVSNCSLILANAGLDVTVTNDLVVDTGGAFGVGRLNMASGSRLSVGGDLVVTNGGALLVYGGETNGTGRVYGTLVAVTGEVAVADGSWVHPYSHWVDGGSVLFRMDALRVAANAGFNAHGKGHFSGNGPGVGVSYGDRGGGGGYGGKGGRGSNTLAVGGPAHGSTNAPAQCGTAGARGAAGGQGGGLVRIEAAGRVTLDGTLDADAGASFSGYSGGGSGGGILILCDEFSGAASGEMTADGSTSSQGGGGGGGRISVAVGLSASDRADLLSGVPVAGMVTYEDHAPYAGAMSVTNGTGYVKAPDPQAPDLGTMQFISAGSYTFVVQGEPFTYGSPLPNGYGTHIDIPADAFVTNTVTSPADELAGERWQCLGWAVTNEVGPVAEGTSTQAVFQLTNNLFITWSWTNEWQLIVSAGPNGTVNLHEVDGWYTNGMQATNILAAPDPGYRFALWVGADVPTGRETDNPLTVTMDQARTLQATFSSLSGETKTWRGTGDWEESAKWDPLGMPSDRDAAIVASGTVTVAFSRAVKSLTVNQDAAMVFTNWSTRLTVSNDVTVMDGGTLTLPPAFTDTQMSNRIHIVCSNLTLAAGALIDGDGKGFAGGNTGYGPGGGMNGSDRGGGGAYGGRGGRGQNGGSLGGSTYGALSAPMDPGSGGGRYGGAGGGSVRLDVSGTVTVDGTISVNGAAGGGYPGGGSGGGVYIICTTFDGGATGRIRADGGNGTTQSGGGGGGRIAVVYTNTVLGRPDVHFSASNGVGWATYDPDNRWPVSEQGTLYVPDLSLLAETLDDGRLDGVDLYFRDATEWRPGSLTVSNCSVTFAQPGFLISVTNAVHVDAAGEFGIGPNVELHCGADMTLTNGGALSIRAGATNGTDRGALLDVGGDLYLGPGSWVYPYSERTNGGSGVCCVRNLYIATNAGFNANGRGYRDQYGPGKGIQGSDRGGGGGYGGVGGKGNNAGAFGGGTYGVTNAPVHAGSGGGRRDAGSGGGLIRIEASGVVALDGTLTANGSATMWGYSGGGAGGGIFLACQGDFEGGVNSALLADGGNGDTTASGGGGGGRIAVWYGTSVEDRQALIASPDSPGIVRRLLIADEYSEFLGASSVTNGVGYTVGPLAEPGTVVFLRVHPTPGTMFIIR